MLKNEVWVQKAVRADFSSLGEKFGLDPVVIRLLVNRGVMTEEQIEKYLNGTLEDLHSPWLFKDMEKVTNYINDYKSEKIAISSDFDCDGIFAAYILKKGLQKVGIHCEIFTPERIAEGYGLNRRIIDEAKQNGCTMILTCDNGIAAVEEVTYAKKLGFVVIITDHHDIQDELPPADAIVNHKQPDCEYPFKGLCGAGVAYKLIEALYETMGISVKQVEELLEFVAIATVADVMDLVGENRILVREGLKRLEHTYNIGLSSLIDVQGLTGEKLRAYHIGFVLGPCFNASGRLKTVQMAFELLDTFDKSKAKKMATELKELNDERKRMTQEGVDQAFHMLEDCDMESKKVLVLLLEDCHESLVGIIAGRVKECFNRPTIVFTNAGDGLVKGSGRSIEAYNMFEGLLECKDRFERFGGHPMAAGITMRAEHIETLERRLNENAKLVESDLYKRIEVDVPMPLSYISEKLIHQLEVLEPFGKGNVKPIFAQSHFRIFRATKRGKYGNVLSMKVVSSEGTKMNAVMFGEINDFDEFIVREFGEKELDKMYRGQDNAIDVSFTYYPTINEYNGYRNIEIQVGRYCACK